MPQFRGHARVTLTADMRNSTPRSLFRTHPSLSAPAARPVEIRISPQKPQLLQNTELRGRWGLQAAQQRRADEAAGTTPWDMSQVPSGGGPPLQPAPHPPAGPPPSPASGPQTQVPCHSRSPPSPCPSPAATSQDSGQGSGQHRAPLPESRFLEALKQNCHLSSTWASSGLTRDKRLLLLEEQALSSRG